MKYAFILLAGLSSAALAQPTFPLVGGKITYEAVVNATGKKAELAKRATAWAAASQYLVGKAQAPGELRGKGRMSVNYPSITVGKTDKGFVLFTFEIYFKDGKYKYTLSNFVHEGKDGRGDGGPLENPTPACGKFIMSTPSWNKIKEQASTEAANVVASLQAALNKTAAPKPKNPRDF